ncbi:rRNA methyltransferase [Bacillus sp. SD088]|uniref:rRNA methyltransferase n=1 Tax=Bacillus sp. SD088 TaxID=2782012 RepID=UPI001A968310|nr:rRNA methyltransferase [Bacillus sp. SD088]MBO0992993.1 rRNA methyltransferase [Bacillus sp. SD088]
MWKLVNGELIHTTDNTRVKFRTNISKNILTQLEHLALENDTHINYLIENGLENLLAKGTIVFEKKTRPKDRIQFKTTYNKDLLEQVKEFAKNHKLFINDIIESSVQYVDLGNVKKTSYKHRVE